MIWIKFGSKIYVILNGSIRQTACNSDDATTWAGRFSATRQQQQAFERGRYRHVLVIYSTYVQATTCTLIWKKPRNPRAFLVMFYASETLSELWRYPNIISYLMQSSRVKVIYDYIANLHVSRPFSKAISPLYSFHSQPTLYIVHSTGPSCSYTPIMFYIKRHHFSPSEWKSLNRSRVFCPCTACSVVLNNISWRSLAMHFSKYAGCSVNHVWTYVY